MAEMNRYTCTTLSQHLENFFAFAGWARLSAKERNARQRLVVTRNRRVHCRVADGRTMPTVGGIFDGGAETLAVYLAIIPSIVSVWTIKLTYDPVDNEQFARANSAPLRNTGNACLAQGRSWRDHHVVSTKSSCPRSTGSVARTLQHTRTIKDSRHRMTRRRQSHKHHK